ncbi:hypothetical protein [Jannaschia sp. R86511]|uniref:RsiG family protein n=1 Tax=Jannaschia sp. R86511 TaxID=3093853 RepID=UPI0036D2D2F8
MHIPRQPDGSREHHADRRDGRAAAGRPGSGPAATGTEGLRTRRRDLVTQQRAVGYWQRLVQARVDLVVAGLLYGAPVPAASALAAGLGVPLTRDRARDTDPGPCAGPDLADLHALAEPPEGLDVSALLGRHRADEGPGAQLQRLRQAALLLAGRRHALDEELDAVTLALHDRLARDGAEPEVTGADDTGAAGAAVGTRAGAPVGAGADRLPTRAATASAVTGPTA